MPETCRDVCTKQRFFVRIVKMKCCDQIDRSLCTASEVLEMIYIYFFYKWACVILVAVMNTAIKLFTFLQMS